MECAVCNNPAYSASTETASYDNFSTCLVCRRDGPETIRTCCLCLCSMHQACCAQLLKENKDVVDRMHVDDSPLDKFDSWPTPIADAVHDLSSMACSNDSFRQSVTSLSCIAMLTISVACACSDAWGNLTSLSFSFFPLGPLGPSRGGSGPP
jgi:hypothetical protein